MGIRKQEFYEGAALHLLVRGGEIDGLHYEAPFFVLNNQTAVLMKYSTKVRSPWGFTFMPDEQMILAKKSIEMKTVITLVCGSDGVAAFSYDEYCVVAAPRNSAIHVACYREHGEHYEVNGPDGKLRSKIPPSGWQRLLERELQ